MNRKYMDASVMSALVSVFFSGAAAIQAVLILGNTGASEAQNILFIVMMTSLSVSGLGALAMLFFVYKAYFSKKE